jgi:hypothetical protein
MSAVWSGRELRVEVEFRPRAVLRSPSGTGWRLGFPAIPVSIRSSVRVASLCVLFGFAERPMSIAASFKALTSMWASVSAGPEATNQA